MLSDPTPTTSKSCWATITASPPHRSRRWQACAPNSARAPRSCTPRVGNWPPSCPPWRPCPPPLSSPPMAPIVAVGSKASTSTRHPSTARCTALPERRRLPRNRTPSRFSCAWTPKSISNGGTARRAPIWMTTTSACAGSASWRPRSPASTGWGASAWKPSKFYLNGKQLWRANNTHERNYSYETVELEAGKFYPLRVDFHEVVNDADMRLVWAVPERDLEAPAPDAARQAEAVVMFLGLSPRLEGEEMKVPVPGFQGGDRLDLALPAAQEALLEKVAALGKPVVLVLLNGSALAVNWASDHVPALLEAWYPGQAGGAAIADVLFGDYNPAGRLPVTFYQSADQLPPFDDYSMKGRTYRYFQGAPLYAFGYGLSYTTFAYGKLD